MQFEDANPLTTTQSPLASLVERLGIPLPNIDRAEKKTADHRRDLMNKWETLFGEDRSIVVFGSLARNEFTEGSDVDWTLLIDGKADHTHLSTALKISEKVSKSPGREGVFGNLAFSHDIVHCIGGEDDTNANTTRRILLLLESTAIGQEDAWRNVRRNILYRYLREDVGLWQKSNERGVPLFLLNDISRYWRTMTVDFAYKQHARDHKEYALKSLKLGFSRKLIYLSGILACMRCELEFPGKELFNGGTPQRAIEHLEKLFAMTPLELLANSLCLDCCFDTEKDSKQKHAAKIAFQEYDAFLGMMADDATRQRLKELSLNEFEQDLVFLDAREKRRKFGEAMKDLFLRIPSPIQKLMIERGVF